MNARSTNLVALLCRVEWTPWRCTNSGIVLKPCSRSILKIENRFIMSTCRRLQTLWCSQYHCLPFSLTCLEPLHTHKFVRRRLLCCLSLQTSGTTLHLPFAAGSTLATNPARVVDHDRARSYFLRNAHLGEGTDITMKVSNHHDDKNGDDEERSQHFRKKWNFEWRMPDCKLQLRNVSKMQRLTTDVTHTIFKST